jgi:EAL domain-containing protein (putative c-di-GMP-specific phosphodiesterase class I)/GGDEF domain-containing protein
MSANNRRPILGVVDIERLDAINRMFGRNEGDRLLNLLIAGLQDAFRTSDFKGSVLKGRRGEVMIIFEFFENWEKQFRNMVQKAISQCKIMDKIPARVSIGAAEVHLGCNLEEFRFMIDHTRQRAKNAPEKWFIMDLPEAVIDVGTTHTEIQDANLVVSALHKGDITAFYQPIIDLNTHKMRHVEALARIRDSKGNWLPAGAFIQKVEELGLYPRLDALIIDAVIRDIEKLNSMICEVYINVSPVTLLTREGLDSVINGINAIREHDMEVTFELTEQTFLDKPELLEELARGYNVRFAVDDFGTGFASINSTITVAEKGLVKALKIDGSLVQDITTIQKKLRIVATIADMAANLGLKNIAEFVEDEPTPEKLKEIGVEMGQGYYFARPMPVEELQKWHSEWKTKLSSDRKKTT